VFGGSGLLQLWCSGFLLFWRRRWRDVIRISLVCKDQNTRNLVFWCDLLRPQNTAFYMRYRAHQNSGFLALWLFGLVVFWRSGTLHMKRGEAMETLAIVATKGGVGKTTLAVHLAVAAQADGLNVVVFDLDPQGSAKQWGRDRDKLAKQSGQWFKTRLDVRSAAPNDLPDSVEQALGEGFDLAIIDAPPHADHAAVQAVHVADLVLVPTRPGYFDLHATKATAALLKSVGAKAFAVVNQVPHNTLRIADDAIAFLESKGLPSAPVIITALQPYMRALRNGLTAPELAPDGRHALEIGTMWSFVKDQCAAVRTDRRASVPARPSLVVPELDGDPLQALAALIRGDAA
jgi:chromosome partitioning protein